MNTNKSLLNKILKKYLPNFESLTQTEIIKEIESILSTKQIKLEQLSKDCGIEAEEALKNRKFVLTTSSKTMDFDGVIIATGAKAKWLGLENEERFLGKGYHSCATCDGFFYKDRTIAVVGGGDSAMEEAGFLTKFAKKVYLIHRSETFKASRIMLERIKQNPKIEMLTYKKVTALNGDSLLRTVTLESTHPDSMGEVSTLELDGLFVAIGHLPNSAFVSNLNLDRDEFGYLLPQSMLPPENRTSHFQTATKVNGIFVAGDIEDSVYRQAISAAGSGCRAAIDMEKWLAEQE